MNKHISGCLVGLILSLAAPVIAQPPAAAPREVMTIQVQGGIGPAIKDYILRAIRISEAANAELLLIQLDTPGGLLDSTQGIVRGILASEVPIAVFVYPQGGSAGSAGVFITLAAHIAAMAPVTNIGAASPVTIGGEGISPRGEEDDAQDRRTTAERKMLEYAESYVESIARLRERNIEWAKSAVRDAAAITANEALELNVIDLMANDPADLLRQLHGWELPDSRTLNTDGARLTPIEMTLGENVLRFLFHPQLMFVLTIIAIYGIIGELSNPGAIFPGVTGAIALVLLLYAIAAVPVNVAGFLLIGFAVALMIAEVFTPSFGILTVGGAVSFLLGSLMLFEDLDPVFHLSWTYVLPVTILTVLFFIFVVGTGLRAQFAATRAGAETLGGRVVEVAKDVDPTGGKVAFDGELWNAVASQPIKTGQKCKIVNRRGLTLHVEPVQESEDNHG